MQTNKLPKIKFLPTKRGYRLAYQVHRSKQPQNKKSGILFLHGHGSDMFGSKAEVMMDWAIQKDVDFTRFDLFGHGQTGGDIMTATVGHWINDTCDIFDNLLEKRQILVGSSLGGWLMLSLCKYRAEKIDSLVGIAAAPDFTKGLIWETLDKLEQERFHTQGYLTIANPYSEADVIYPYRLIEEAENHLVLEHPIEFYGRVILHHGLCDAEVPWQTSIEIAKKLRSNRVEIHLDKSANHRYSNKEQLNALLQSLEELISMK